MKKFKFIFLNSFVILLVLFAGYSVFAQTETSAFMSKWGQLLSNYADDVDNESTELFAKGKTAEVTNADVEQATEFYVLSGLSRERAYEEAIQYVEQREALYQNAVRAGYTVTDAEVLEYLEELKSIINEADNKEDAYAVIGSFPSESEYWNYQFSVYKKNLPIQKYVEDLKVQYEARSGKARTSAEFSEEFNAYYDELKENLVEQEEYQIME